MIVCTVFVLGRGLGCVGLVLVLVVQYSWLVASGLAACSFRVLIAAIGSFSCDIRSLQTLTMPEMSGCVHQLSCAMQLTWGTPHITRHGARHDNRQGQP